MSNKVIYEVRLDTRLMGKTQGEINAVLMALVEAARAEGVEWSDSLPITRTAPFRFTTENPYFVTEQDEEGVEVKTLTRLGRLAVKMKWIQDPTQEPQDETEPEKPQKPSLTDSIKAFFGMGKKEPEQPREPEGPQPLPTAEQLLGRMCESFSIAG